MDEVLIPAEFKNNNTPPEQTEKAFLGPHELEHACACVVDGLIIYLYVHSYMLNLYRSYIMFTGFSLMLQAFFRALTKLASALERTASAGDHLAGWMDDTAATFADQARIEREKKLAVLNHNRDQQAITLANTTGQVNTEEPAAVPA